MNLSGVERMLNGILKELDDELDTQLRNYRTTGNAMNFDEVKNKLKEIDENIIGNAKIADEMVKGNADLKNLIDRVNRETINKIEGLEFYIDKNEVDELREDVENNRTNSTQRRLEELDDENKKDNYKREDVNTRMKKAKEEYSNAKKVADKYDDYEDLKKNSGNTDKQLKEEYKNFGDKTVNWHDNLMKLEHIKNTNYVAKIDNLANLANSNIEVSDEIVNEWKDLKKDLQYLISDNTLNGTSTKIKDALNGDPTRMDINAVRDTLQKLQNEQIEENMPEIKDSESFMKDENNSLKTAMSSSNILNIFPEEKNKIEKYIEDDSIPLEDKWDYIQNFVNENKKVVSELGNTKAKDVYKNAYDSKVKLDNIKNEKLDNLERQDKIDKAEAVMNQIDINEDTTKLDLSNWGINTPLELNDENGNPYDFAKIGEGLPDDEKAEAKKEVIEKLRSKIYDNKNLFDKVKKGLESGAIEDKYKKTGGLVEVKQGFLSRLFKRKPKMDWKANIEYALEKKLEEAEVFSQAKEEKNNAWDLSTEEMEAFKTAEAQIIVEAGQKGEKISDKEVSKRAESKMGER